MNDRVWMGAGLVALGVLIFLGIGYFLSGNSGDQEFQKMLEATKQIKTFRSVYIASASSGQHSERLWEVDCNRGIIHKQSRDLQPGANAGFDIKEDEFLVGLGQLAAHKQWSIAQIQSALAQRRIDPMGRFICHRWASFMDRPFDHLVGQRHAIRPVHI